MYTNSINSALEDASVAVDYDLYVIATHGEPTWENLRSYPTLIWVCGSQQTNTLTESNRLILAQYLNAGGHLLLTGQYIDQELGNNSFVNDYLHVFSLGGYRHRIIDRHSR